MHFCRKELLYQHFIYIPFSSLQYSHNELLCLCLEVTDTLFFHFHACSQSQYIGWTKFAEQFAVSDTSQLPHFFFSHKILFQKWSSIKN